MSDKKDKKPIKKAKAAPKPKPKPKKPSLTIDEVKSNYKKARRGVSAAKKAELLEQFKKDMATF